MIGNTPARTPRPRALLSALLLTSAMLPAAYAADKGSEEITVTAQRKSETVQKVPIAVSAFGQDQLQKSKLDGGPDLVKSVPNVNFSKGNFTGSNFSIRGIGSKVVAGSGDAATGVALNNAPEIANNLFETDFYDVDRVEVLRGPQGTLYGRNATSGLVNVFTRRPEFGVTGGDFRAEYGNFNSVKLKGSLNIPIGETAAVRLAGYYLRRDGFGDNLFTGNDADDRNLFGLRATFGWQPTSKFKMYLMVDHFNERDNRSRIGKQFCVKDTGPANVAGQNFSSVAAIASIQQGFFSQGCKNASIYDAAALGTVDSRATLGGLFGELGGFQTGDAYAGKTQTPGFHDIESTFDPIYRSNTDIYQLNADWDVTPDLTLSLQGNYTEFDLFTRQDYNRYTPTSNFNVVPNPVNVFATPVGGAAVYNAIYAGIFPGGVVSDPQNGNFNRFTTSDISSALTEQSYVELRLASHFDGPFNFSIGANYTNFDATGDYYVMFNTGTAYYQVNNALTTGNPNCFSGAPCVAVDPNQDPNRSGHNYYDAYSPYNLQSTAFFGEVYYDVTDAIQLIGGIRYTDDEKSVDQYPVILGTQGIGNTSFVNYRVGFKETTGRAGFKWDLKDTLGGSSNLYAFYSRGYKSGGINSPCSNLTPGVICGPATFQPEFINSYEIGLKNQFLDNRLTLNLTGFYYDYQGYQVSLIVNRASTNVNIDAKIKGAEFEGSYSIFDGFRINAAVGYLDTEINDGFAFTDEENLTGGNPNVTLIKSSAASNCVIPTAIAQRYVAASNAISNPYLLLSACNVTTNTGQGSPIVAGGPPAAGTNAGTPLPGPLAPLSIPAYLVSAGQPINVGGNELPNAPHWTISLGAQYTFQIADNWDMTIRGDYYHQTRTFARIYNDDSDFLKSYQSLNFTVTVADPDLGLAFDAYVKNATDETYITDTYLTDASSGLFRNGFVSDPRTYGIAVTYSF